MIYLLFFSGEGQHGCLGEHHRQRWWYHRRVCLTLRRYVQPIGCDVGQYENVCCHVRRYRLIQELRRISIRNVNVKKGSRRRRRYVQKVRCVFNLV